MHGYKELNIPESMKKFLQESDRNYHLRVKTLPLFDPEKTARWTSKQKHYFASVFYHLRGHFIYFMWYVANFSLDANIKKIIIENIKEELGVDKRLSHEMLYQQFAQACHVDIQNEMISEEHYLPFARKFNKDHLEWLTKHDELECLAAFSAYERLDNLDYIHLTELAKSLQLDETAILFFKVHVNVDHFESALELLIPIWKKYPKKVKNSFEFIYSHQYVMWENFSNNLGNVANVFSDEKNS